jgi:hypothetical protein
MFLGRGQVKRPFVARLVVLWLAILPHRCSIFLHGTGSLSYWTGLIEPLHLHCTTRWSKCSSLIRGTNRFKSEYRDLCLSQKARMNNREPSGLVRYLLTLSTIVPNTVNTIVISPPYLSHSGCCKANRHDPSRISRQSLTSWVERTRTSIQRWIRTPRCRLAFNEAQVRAEPLFVSVCHRHHHWHRHNEYEGRIEISIR